jgi:phosphoglucomutase/phosphomannomutase
MLANKYKDQNQGSSAAGRLRSWIAGELPFTYPEVLSEHLSEEHISLLFDAFWQVVPFGTGGRRGRVGYGSNRINPTTIAITVQGHCDYLHATFGREKELSVVVANDVRVFNDLAGAYRFLGTQHPLLGLSSRRLGRLACEIYAANNIIAYFAEPRQEFAVLSTPELSYLISQLQAVGGVNISASHNPPDDNGIKLYDEFGSQPIAPNDQRLVEAMDRVHSVERMTFEDAIASNMVRPVPPGFHQSYISTYISLFGVQNRVDADLPIVFTPLCGCGLTTVGEVLTALKFTVLIPPDQGPDGTFAAIPFRAPNPEVPQATEPAKEFADSQGSGIVLSSDPDADRIGLEVKLANGSWHHCDGNQIAAILCYYLMLDPQGPRRKGLVIETLVTTRIIGKIVERAGDSFLVDDLLVGFKYVADVLKTLRKGQPYKQITCSPDRLVLATEESHGVIVVPTILDKDAVPACMYLAALYQRLRREGRNLLDYYIDVLDDVGPYADSNRSIMMNGADGVGMRDSIIASLRETPLHSIDGLVLRSVIDHWDTNQFGPFVSETDKLPRNVIQFVYDSLVVTVRPSGTEPKLKFYCQVMPDSDLLKTHGQQRYETVMGKAERVALLVYGQLLARLNIHLEEPALLLPDIVDLGRKMDFQTNIVPALYAALSSGELAHLDQALGWLKEQARLMTPGANPLPALKAPLIYLCRKWQAGGKGNSTLISDLAEWASRGNEVKD